MSNTVRIIKDIAKLCNSLDGYLSPKEATFIATLPFIKKEGEILEIGSFKGKSTILLAKAAQSISKKIKIHACDSFLLSQKSDPKINNPNELFDIFNNNIRKHKVEKNITIHRTTSQNLAKKWTFPLKALWIDGDHSYEGVYQDFTNYKIFLSEGSIVAFHDTLSTFTGPMRVFINEILLSPNFIFCGITSSIAWAQYSHNTHITQQQWEEKINLAIKLHRVLPISFRIENNLPYSKLIYKYRRSQVPHKIINISKWLDKVNKVT